MATTSIILRLSRATRVGPSPRQLVVPAFRRGFAEISGEISKDETVTDEEKVTSPRVSGDASSEPTDEGRTEGKKNMTVTEKDAEIMERWRERQGSLANAELEDGQVDSGLRRNVKANIFRYI